MCVQVCMGGERGEGGHWSKGFWGCKKVQQNAGLCGKEFEEMMKPEKHSDSHAMVILKGKNKLNTTKNQIFDFSFL